MIPTKPPCHARHRLSTITTRLAMRNSVRTSIMAVLLLLVVARGVPVVGQVPAHASAAGLAHTSLAPADSPHRSPSPCLQPLAVAARAVRAAPGPGRPAATPDTPRPLDRQWCASGPA